MKYCKFALAIRAVRPPNHPPARRGGRGRQIKWTLVASAAAFRARNRFAASVAMGQEAVIVQLLPTMPDNNASQPSVVLGSIREQLELLESLVIPCRRCDLREPPDVDEQQSRSI